MRTMKKSKMICAAVLTGVLGAAALAGCAQEMADTGATYNPGEPPLLQSTLQGHHLPVDLHADLIFKFYQQGLIAHVM